MYSIHLWWLRFTTKRVQRRDRRRGLLVTEYYKLFKNMKQAAKNGKSEFVALYTSNVLSPVDVGILVHNLVHCGYKAYDERVSEDPEILTRLVVAW